MRLIFVLLFSVLMLSGCQTTLESITKDLRDAWPFEREAAVKRIRHDFKFRTVSLGSPVFIRIFKQSAKLEVWIQENGTDRYALYKSYPICTYSGKLGPKQREGDKQSPEGFYQVRAQDMNPNSKYHLSFNLGFPNAYDVSLGRTGSYIMVHGGCKSVGCYAMTDGGIEDIYTIVEMAQRKGQSAVPVHVFPFRMTDDNMSAHRFSKWASFWKNLKTGYDYFELTKKPPQIFFQGDKYLFEPS